MSEKKERIIFCFENETNPDMRAKLKKFLKQEYLQTTLNVAAECFDPSKEGIEDYEEKSKHIHAEYKLMKNADNALKMHMVINNSEFLDQIDFAQIMSNVTAAMKYAYSYNKIKVDTFLETFFKYSRQLQQAYEEDYDNIRENQIRKLCDNASLMKITWAETIRYDLLDATKTNLKRFNFYKEHPGFMPYHSMFLKDNPSAQANGESDLLEIINKYGYFSLIKDHNGQGDRECQSYIDPGASVVIDVINQDQDCEQCSFYYVRFNVLILVIPDEDIMPSFSLEGIEHMSIEHLDDFNCKYIFIKMSE